MYLYSLQIKWDFKKKIPLSYFQRTYGWTPPRVSVTINRIHLLLLKLILPLELVRLFVINSKQKENKDEEQII